MRVVETELPGVLIIEPKVHGDERGFFVETFQAERYASQAGIALAFVQDNHSRSRRGVLRGLHAQKLHPQGKLVRVSRGEVFDVAVDIDPHSPRFGKWVGVSLSDINGRQLWIPPGYAHGFAVISELVDFEYKCTDYYHPEDEVGLRWNDPEVAISWPLDAPMVSAKDATLPTLAQIRGAA
jgi:dTDP-4-dehydrorhamnose 3,5-epimerase